MVRADQAGRQLAADAYRRSQGVEAQTAANAFAAMEANLMGIPAIGLQTVFAHQTASVVTEAQHRQLRGTVRGVLAATLVVVATLAAAGVSAAP